MFKMKTIWIINQNASTPDTGYAGRSYYLAEELGKLGYKVYLIAGGYSHLHFRRPTINNDIEIVKNNNFDFVWIDLPSYDNAHSKKRILNWFIFAYRLTKLIKIIPQKPNFLIYSSPPLIGFLGALIIKFRTKTKLIFEVRDLWPLTLKIMGGYSWYNPFMILMSYIEKIAYKKSDLIISNLSNAFQYIKKFKINKSKYLWLPNGVSEFEINKKTPLSKDVANLIPKDKFIIGYCGTLGLANAIEFFVQTSLELRSQSEYYFVIVGDGREKHRLMSMVTNSKNIIFINSIPKQQVHSLFSFFDVCYIGWRKHNLYEFGIGSNKLPEYLFSRKPIIHSYSGKNDIVKIANAGISVEAESVIEIIKAINLLHSYSKSKLDIFGQNGFLYAKNKLTYKVLAQELINNID
jgi:hypothetical protein